MGTYKVRNEIETKRNEINENETKSTKTKRNEINEMKRNQRKQNEIN
jgi:cell division protein FtsL